MAGIWQNVKKFKGYGYFCEALSVTECRVQIRENLILNVGISETTLFQ